MPEETRTASQEWDEIANIRSIHSSGFARCLVPQSYVVDLIKNG